MAENRMTAKRLTEEFGIFVSSEFVPFSKSRNAKKDAEPSEMSLNWKVTVRYCSTYPFAPENAKREMLTTDYTAGIAHCPSYKQNTRWTLEYAAVIALECETGRKARPVGYKPYALTLTGHDQVQPEAADVVYSLIMDSDVIEYATFEDWADSIGFDTDSRKAEQTYRACLEIGLRLRSALGDLILTKLRDAYQDF